MFFPGRMSPEKTDFSWFRRLRPAEVCDACPTGRVRWVGKAGGCLRGCPAGRVRWSGKTGGCLRGCPAGRVRWSGMAGGCLWGVPCRASLLGRKGRWMPVGRALPGESVGAERPADTYGVCPAGRVCWVGKAGGCLWGVPCRASPLGRKGRRMPMGCALPGESVGAEGPADACGGALPGESVGTERPADVCGVCPAGRVRWSGMAGGCLWGVPCRASLLGRKGRWMPVGRALPGESVGSERPADACGPVRWVGEAGGNLRRFLGPLWEWFSCSGPMFSFWEKIF